MGAPGGVLFFGEQETECPINRRTSFRRAFISFKIARVSFFGICVMLLRTGNLGS
jgi:hypothetical protein